MLFTSYVFFLFLPLVLAGYWALKPYRRAQNGLLLVASYIFYGWWDWRFLFLIAGSSVVDFLVARQMGRSESEGQRTLLMWLSALVNLGVLGYFKYANFFLENLAVLIEGLTGQAPAWGAWSIILPLGISFYTFQTLGYTIDVYRREVKPTRNFLEYLTFVSFFPQLVAGPIERARNLLPQFLAERRWKQQDWLEGGRLILWGFFKKVAIADALAPSVNYVFANHETLNGATLATGALLFTFQMYCDFSGYSDIAIGVARLLGFRLMKNFDFPFYSTSMSAFWRRWHISLSTWILDYLYTPLSIKFRYGGLWGLALALLISFALSGLWHGAAWTFVVWGALHGMVLAYEALSKKRRKRWAKKTGNWYTWASRILVFFFWVGTLTIFRAEHMGQAFSVLSGALLGSWSSLAINPSVLLLPVGLLVYEYFQRNRAHGLDVAGYHYTLRWSLYAFALIMIFSSQNLNNQNEFIYFQF
jgi:D-alanyl-lipoteichoic acid acyltransferase DltB (MBOAT superfamily)